MLHNVLQQGKEFPTLRSINHSCTSAATTAVAATSNVSTSTAVINTATNHSYDIPTSGTERATTTAGITSTKDTATLTITNTSIILLLSLLHLMIPPLVLNLPLLTCRSN